MAMGYRHNRLLSAMLMTPDFLMNLNSPSGEFRSFFMKK